MTYTEQRQHETYNQAVVSDQPITGRWTFLTNHAHVLIAISRNPEVRQRDIAASVGITIGAVQRIVQELEAGNYIESERVGRRNRYRLIDGKPLRHPLEAGHTVDDLITTLD